MEYNNILNTLDSYSKNCWQNIQNNIIGETTITETILNYIVSSYKRSSYIEYVKKDKKGYKYDEVDTINNKGTCADFMICINDKNNKKHYFAFQSKLGKLNGKTTNDYIEIIHKVGKTSRYQIDGFENFLNSNRGKDFKGYYLFYNGLYSKNDNNYIKDERSFYISSIKNVKNLMQNNKLRKKYGKICLKDVSLSNDNKNFVDFLNKNL